MKNRHLHREPLVKRLAPQQSSETNSNDHVHFPEQDENIDNEVGCGLTFLFSCLASTSSQHSERDPGSAFTQQEKEASGVTSDNMSAHSAHAPVVIEVPYPTVEEYREKAKDAFYFIPNDNNAKIWSTCYTSRIGYFKSIVDNAKSEQKPLIILTGTHGSASGKRTAKMQDPKMYPAKVKTYVGDGEHRCKYIQVVDICALQGEELATILKGKTDVIISFCYSRNDAEIRGILNWPAEKSYIKPVEQWHVPHVQPKVRIVVNETGEADRP